MKLPIFEKFKVKKMLSRKASFSVFEAVDLRNDALVQLKVLDASLSNDEPAVMNFLNSARIIKHLNHPNICNIHDFGADNKNGHYFLASERIQSESLNALILDEFSLSLEDLIDIFTAIGLTLRNAHLHGLVHGILNPNSIYIKPDGAIKIDDFGFSWHVPKIIEQTDADSLYLAKYVAPDFYDNPANVDGRADIYSLGLILYEIIACKNPFQGKTIAAIKAQHLAATLPAIDLEKLGLPDELAQVFSKATRVNPESRFQNFKEYLGALEKLKTSSSVSSSSPSVDKKIDFAFNSSEEEKYFDDSGVLSYNDSTAAEGSFFNKKFALTGVGALFLVLLVLFVTNYIPLPFGGNEGIDMSEYTESTDMEQSKEDEEELLADLVQTNGLLSEGSEKDEESDLTQSSDANTFETRKLHAAENPQESNDFDSKEQPPVNNIDLEKPTKKAPLSKPATRKADTKSKKTETPPAKPKSKKPVIKSSPVKQAEVQRAQLNFEVTSDEDPIEANIFVNNKFAGKTDSDGELQVPDLSVNKTYAIRVSKQGYATVNKQIKVQANNAPMAIDLKSERDLFGTLLLDAEPLAHEVYVDGIRHKGRTPMRISLKHGRHKIKMVNAQLKITWEEEIDLKVGQVLRLKHDFTKKEMGQVAISLKNAAQYGFGFVHVDGKLWHESHQTTPLEIKLPIGSHTIEVKRDGFNSIPKDVIVNVEKGQTKYVSFTFTRENKTN